jgi:uncharacterized protein (TIGR00159 family)
MFWSGFSPDDWLKILWHFFDFFLVCAIIYGMLLIIGERRTLWMVRGLFLLMIITIIAQKIKLVLLSFFLEKLIIISALSIALVFQSDFRRFLEQLGKGQFSQLLPAKNSLPKEDNVMDEIVEAVKDLSQNRTGALILMETFNTIEERIFVNKGVYLNADVSKELLQTIFQTKTLLHDGAVFIRGSEIVSAGVILPLSERDASQQLGTRHRAAMGITERLHNCICVVISEETGSISLGYKGVLNRPLTSTKLKELLEEKLSMSKEKESKISGKISFPPWAIFKTLINFIFPKSGKK